MSPGSRKSSLTRSSSGPAVWLIVAVLLGAVGGLAYWRWKQAHPDTPPLTDLTPTPTAPPSVEPTAAPLAKGDELLRSLGAELSRAPELAAWLGEPDIVRRLTTAVRLVAEGKSPRPVLGFLSPGGQFEVDRARGKRAPLRASAKSYARYDPVARVVTGIPPEGVATTYVKLKPFIDTAFAEIAPPGQTFEQTAKAALQMLATVEIPTERPALKPQGLGYVYVDPKLEALSPAQKNLLRLGPDNARAVQTWLGKVQAAVFP